MAYVQFVTILYHLAWLPIPCTNVQVQHHNFHQTSYTCIETS